MATKTNTAQTTSMPSINSDVLKDLENTAASISASIDSIVQKFPKEFEMVGIAALGAAFGCKFSKTTLFLGSIYLLGKILQQRG